MDFYFVSNEKKLFGSELKLTTTDIQNVTRWQQNMSYHFNWHTGTHGDACVYLKGKTNSYNLPCIWLEGTKCLDSRGSIPNDAIEVVSSNLDLFLIMYGNFYGMSDNTNNITNIEVSIVRQEYRCRKCGKNYGMYTSLLDAGICFGGGYPPRCTNKSCGGVVGPTEAYNPSS